MTLDELLQGQIPDSIEDKTAAASQLVALSRRIVPVTSLLIASARRDNFRNDVTAWTVWCRETLAMDGSDRDHRRQIGDLLLDTRADNAVYNTLFALPFDKLLVLSRIDAGQIGAFLSHYDVKNLRRDELREAVANWLGEEPKVRHETPDLPGFTLALEAINAMEPEAICTRIGDQDAAMSALRAGMGLLGGALEYHKREKKDVQMLQELKSSLLNEVKELERVIEECCIQHCENYV